MLAQTAATLKFLSDAKISYIDKKNVEEFVYVTQPNLQYWMGINAAQHFMNQATFHLTFPILVITKIFWSDAQLDTKGKIP